MNLNSLKTLKTQLIAAAILTGAALSGPAMADPDPAMYCDCLVRCGKLHPGGGIPYASCVYNCDMAYGPAICPDAITDIAKDRR